MKGVGGKRRKWCQQQSRGRKRANGSCDRSNRDNICFNRGNNTKLFNQKSDFRENNIIKLRGCSENFVNNDNPEEIGAFVNYMPITLILITFNMGRLLFCVFISVVLSIMPRWGYNGTRLMRLNRWERYKFVEIWWHIFSDEIVLHIFSSFNRSLSSSFPVSFQICPVLSSLSSQLCDSNLTFSASENGFRLKYMFIRCNQSKKT